MGHTGYKVKLGGKTEIQKVNRISQMDSMQKKYGEKLSLLQNRQRMWKLCILLCLTLSSVAWAVGSGLSPGGAASGSGRTRLTRTPNPMDTSTNLIVTGNITAGKSFQGVVPYQASTSFSGPMGSSALDSFIRDSAGSESFGRSAGQSVPYYSPTSSVTTTLPGYHGGVFAPQGQTFGSNYPAGRLPDEATLTQPQTQPAGGAASSQYKHFVSSPYYHPPVLPPNRPMSMTTEEMEKMISSDAERYSRNMNLQPTGVGDEQQQEQIEQLKNDLGQAGKKVSELKQSLAKELSAPKGLSKEGLQPFEKVQAQAPKQKTAKKEQADVFEQMKQQLEDFKKSFESEQTGKTTKQPAKPSVDTNEPGRREEKETKPPEEGASKEKPTVDKISPVDLAVKAKGILGEHNSFASFAKDKFNQHVKTAENYMKQGQYYRAADAYTLASYYKPEDPLAYAGKSYALFAAGEYMSSSLFLSRALEIFPEYALFKINLETMIGDRDKLESRIVEVEQRLEKSNAPELQFLLAYVYYQLGRTEAAKKAIDEAYLMMPQWPAAKTLKKVLDEK
jgi:tetratricopeptide (TPR) repeat protein